MAQKKQEAEEEMEDILPEANMLFGSNRRSTSRASLFSGPRLSAFVKAPSDSSQLLAFTDVYNMERS